jgi:hypothetical protein
VTGWLEAGGGDGTARSQCGDARRQFMLVSELMARKLGGRWSATNASMADHRRGEGANERSLPTRERVDAREKGRAWLTGVARLTTRERRARRERGRA